MIAEIIKKTKIINHTKSKIAEIETAELKDACLPKKSFGTWQFGKIGVLVNFVIQKLKSKKLVCLSFLW